MRIKCITNKMYDYLNDRLDIDDKKSLENDKIFMMTLIDNTDDISLLGKCSKDVLYDYEFIKFLIFKYKDNHEFLINDVNNILERRYEYTNDFSQNIELRIMLYNIYQENKYDDMISISNSSDDIYFSYMNVGMQCINTNDIYEFYKSFFYNIHEIYCDKPIIVNFFAQKITDDLFGIINDNFTNLIHEILDKPIDSNKINNFIINYINKYDEILANYLIIHIDLLEPIKKEFNKVFRDWDNFEIENNRKKIKFIFEKLNEYYEVNNKNGIRFCPIKLIKTLVKEYNLEKIFSTDESYMKSSNEMITNFDDLNHVEKVYYNYARFLINNVFYNKYKVMENIDLNDNISKIKIYCGNK